jgi:hypothetical protein
MLVINGGVFSGSPVFIFISRMVNPFALNGRS